MTVRYAAKLATNTSLGCFTKLLFRWRGSVYKLIWAEYLVFIVLYYLTSFVYRFALNQEQQELFGKVVNYCEKSRGSLEMSFVLGFFVSSIVAKWWHLYSTIPWPDPVALFLNANVQGNDEATLQLKRRIVRYCNLNLILTFRAISPPFERRFPTLKHLIKEGLLTDEEHKIMEKIEKEVNSTSTEWIPITWATELTMKARTEGRISNDFACQKILKELDKFRHGCALLLEYEYCSVPLVYIQVVTIAVYTYFVFCLIGSQWLYHDKIAENLDDLDLYFPFFSTLQLIFYMGWLKVAEALVNPFGCDDDDFEIDEIVERHIKVSYMMAGNGIAKPYPFGEQKLNLGNGNLSFEVRSYKGEPEFKGAFASVSNNSDDRQQLKLVSAPPILSDVEVVELEKVQGQRGANYVGVMETIYI